jgi:hypothetical protein
MSDGFGTLPVILGFSHCNAEQKDSDDEVKRGQECQNLEEENKEVVL